jgi:hypothetical protein
MKGGLGGGGVIHRLNVNQNEKRAARAGVADLAATASAAMASESLAERTSQQRRGCDATI